MDSGLKKRLEMFEDVHNRSAGDVAVKQARLNFWRMAQSCRAMATELTVAPSFRGRSIHALVCMPALQQDQRIHVWTAEEIQART